MKMRGLIAFLVVLAVAAAAVFAAPLWSRDRLGSIPTTVVQRGTFVDYLQVRGEIRPVRSTVLTAPSAGTDLQIIELGANGATVAPGDVVIQFDSTTQQRAVEQRRSELKEAESEVERIQTESTRRLQAADTELAQARSALARARLDVTAAELVSRIEADRRALLLANAQLQVGALERKVEGERIAAAADLAIARQKREKAQYDVEETERIIDSLTLRAPAAGTISLLPNFRAGGPMSGAPPEFKRGDRVYFGAPIAELPDLTSVQMTCRLDEADRARVQTGTPVLVRVDAVPDRELPARLTEIGLMARPDFSSWPPIRNFDVVVAIAEADPRLRSGMNASARIEMNRFSDVIVVPAGAVFQTGGTTVAYVVEGGSTSPRPVTVLRRGRDQVAIQSGLREGERIALRDPGEVAP
jgi:multidrug efflux pump subunit AcrA (membrane-fusion protein)